MNPKKALPLLLALAMLAPGNTAFASRPDVNWDGLKGGIWKVAKFLGKPGFMGACRLVYSQWKRNIAKTGQPRALQGRNRDLLVEEFGEDFVSRVNIRQGAQMQRITIGPYGIGPVKIGPFHIGIEAGAQTFGHDVYIRDWFRPDDDWHPVLLAHEFIHVKQVEEGDFSKRYCQALLDSNFDYFRNDLEMEAAQFEEEFACRHHLLGKCPTKPSNEPQPEGAESSDPPY